MSAELECQGEAVAICPSQGRLLTFIAIVRVVLVLITP
jgi:hypothetical protein